jgi:N utilization substance protein B
MLRIKVMQSIFSFEQCKEANFGLSLEYLSDRFQPDLNSMQVQDKTLLARQRKAATAYFEKKFADPALPPNEDAEINRATAEAQALYDKNVAKDFQHIAKNLVTEVERLAHLYTSILGLLVALAEVAAADKRGAHKNLVENSWIKALRRNEELKKALLKNPFAWSEKGEMVRGWFRDVLKPDKTYTAYAEAVSPTIDEQRALMKHLLRKIILQGTVNAYFEEVDLHWAEDHDIVKGLVERTLKSWDEQTGEVEIQKLSLDWEDDRHFISTLYQEAIQLPAAHRKLIADNTRNWEVERLPLTDRIILEMAMAEMIHFPAIPVKVSINEYIELTKEYSTPNSRQFVNGILDVISKELQKQGAIRKSGRGLIDNK